MSLQSRVRRIEQGLGEGPTTPPDVARILADLHYGIVEMEDLTAEQLERMAGKGWDDVGRAAIESLSNEVLLGVEAGDKLALATFKRTIAQFRRCAQGR